MRCHPATNRVADHINNNACAPHLVVLHIARTLSCVCRTVCREITSHVHLVTLPLVFCPLSLDDAPLHHNTPRTERTFAGARPQTTHERTRNMRCGTLATTLFRRSAYNLECSLSLLAAFQLRVSISAYVTPTRNGFCVLYVFVISPRSSCTRRARTSFRCYELCLLLTSRLS